MDSIGILTEFKEFLREYKVIGLAVALIIGLAATSLVKSIVDNLVMPIVTPFTPSIPRFNSSWVHFR